MCVCLCVCYVCWKHVCLCVSVFSIIKYNICILSVSLALLPSLPPCLSPLSLLSFCTSRELIFLRFLWLFLVLVLWQVLQTSENIMSTLPDHLWNNTHSKKAHQKEKSSECISLWSGFLDQKEEYRLVRSKTACTSLLPQKSTNLHFHTRWPAFQDTPSVSKLKDTSRHVSRGLTHTRVPLRGRRSQKGRVWGWDTVRMWPLFAWSH